MKHILVVDDNKVDLAAAKKLFSGTYHVTAVTSGAQALQFPEKNRCLKEGAPDLITKPFSEPVMLSRVNRVIKLAEKKNSLEAMLSERMRHIRHIQEMMVIGMATMVESRDNSTGGHIKRTSDVVNIFSQSLIGAAPDMSEDILDMVTRAAPCTTRERSQLTMLSSESRADLPKRSTPR